MELFKIANSTDTKTLGLTVRADFPWKGREFRLKFAKMFNLMWDNIIPEKQSALLEQEGADIELLSELLV